MSTPMEVEAILRTQRLTKLLHSRLAKKIIIQPLTSITYSLHLKTKQNMTPPKPETWKQYIPPPMSWKLVTHQKSRKRAIQPKFYQLVTHQKSRKRAIQPKPYKLVTHQKSRKRALQPKFYQLITHQKSRKRAIQPKIG